MWFAERIARLLYNTTGELSCDAESPAPALYHHHVAQRAIVSLGGLAGPTRRQGKRAWPLRPLWDPEVGHIVVRRVDKPQPRCYIRGELNVVSGDIYRGQSIKSVLQARVAYWLD